MPDVLIASILNRSGRRTGKEHTWTAERVRSFRKDHKIIVYREGERTERGELTLEETARELKVSEMTVLRLIRRGVLPAEQICKGAPWVIRKVDLDLEDVKQAVRSGVDRPLTDDERQNSFDFQ
ncbi:hypothetical protein CCP4SC76_300002 [Gammaproteobacteria bacterium]